MGCAVKICGLCSREDALAVAARQPDAMGFVFWKGSPRAVKPCEVAKWVREIPSNIQKVGVFVDDPPERIGEVAANVGLDVVQWYPFQRLEKTISLVPKIVDRLRPQGVKIWLAVRVGESEERALDLAEYVDAFVADSYSAVTPGGTGKVGNWEAAREFVLKAPKPVWLAGGLTPENVRSAVEQVRPWGVDVSSGVERRLREKDLLKVERFIAACRG